MHLGRRQREVDKRGKRGKDREGNVFHPHRVSTQIKNRKTRENKMFRGPFLFKSAGFPQHARSFRTTRFHTPRNKTKPETQHAENRCGTKTNKTKKGPRRHPPRVAGRIDDTCTFSTTKTKPCASTPPPAVTAGTEGDGLDGYVFPGLMHHRLPPGAIESQIAPWGHIITGCPLGR